MQRTIQAVLPAIPMDMDGIPILQPFPTPEWRQIDPFLLLHHGTITLLSDRDPDSAGVGPHPHKGFSPVTFIFEGGIRHRDTLGNDSTIHQGGTQWMNAGRGMMHSERPAKANPSIHSESAATAPPHHTEPHRTELIQLWVNTPRDRKEDDPQYYPLTREATPHAEIAGGMGDVFVQAGRLFGLSGPIPTPSEVNAATLYLKAGATVRTAVPPTHNTVLYLLDGAVQVEGVAVPARNAVVFSIGEDEIAFDALEQTRALLVTGEPIAEPLAMYGPFVMNYQGEIRQAILDFQAGRMGELAE